MSGVRLAVPDDEAVLVETVSVAFAHDPAWMYMLGAGNTAGATTFARALLVPRVAAGTVWLVDDGVAVAMWDRVAPEPRPSIPGWWAEFDREVGAEVASRVAAYDAVVKTAAPPRPYWYLGVLATHPDHQGRGLGSTLLETGFAAAAADGWDCWLETSTAGNKDFYEARGFTESVPVEIPGGPPTWWLRRPHGTAR